jgi:Prealbumin-like fold domain
MMRSVPFAPAAAVLVAILVAVPPSVLAAGPQGRKSDAAVASVGTRTDLPLPPVKGPPGSPPAGQRASTWRSLDGKAFEQAKAAANAAAQGGSGPTVYKNDFSIIATPSTLTLAQGTVGTSTITTAATSGRPQTVSLSVSGTPSGATVSLSPTSVTAGASSTLTVNAGTAAPGTYSLVVRGTEGGVTHTTTVTLGVTANPAHLTLMKSVSGGTAVATNWTLTASAGSTVVLSGTSGVNADLTAGTYALAESTGPANYSPSAWNCSAGSLSGANISLAPGQTATCTITNTYSPPGGPTASPSWSGEYQGGLAPPDPTGAIGPNSYIELINLRYGIYGRDGNLLPSSGSEGDFTALMGLPVSELSDPQILWDPGAQRFYYTALDVARYGFAFGYSKSASPQSGADFCKYILNYGYANTATLPDYPKLGVTQDFVLIGSNDFLLGSIYNGSNVNWLAKPTDPSCPGTIGPGGTFASLKNAGGSLMSTPVPAFSADPSSTGYVVGSVDVGTGSGSVLTVFKVTKDPSTGNATMSGPYPVSVPLPYKVPADAPQKGVTAVLDTMDTRLTHAVAALDPNLGATAVWTAHTVYGGAGAEDRWYEINVGGTPFLAQSGTVTDSSLYVWNGAISPNRANDGTTGAFGGDMVMGFNTSSSATFPSIQMVSKKGSAAQSAWVPITQPMGPNVDFTCGPTCRWGDYSGATPDPVASASGHVWLSGEWNLPKTDGSATVWRTWNWAAQP